MCFPWEILSIACGAGVGIFSASCGISVGVISKCAGLAIGGKGECVGPELFLVKDDSDSSFAALIFVTLVIGAFLAFMTSKYYETTLMTQRATLTWDAKVKKSQGLFIEKDSKCSAFATIRSDGSKRMHTELTVQCGNLVLAQRRLTSETMLIQKEENGEYIYQLSFNAPYKSSTSTDEGDFTAEKPGLHLDSTLANPVLTLIKRESPMHIEFEISQYSRPHCVRLLNKDTLVGKGFWE